MINSFHLIHLKVVKSPKCLASSVENSRTNDTLSKQLHLSKLVGLFNYRSRCNT